MTQLKAGKQNKRQKTEHLMTVNRATDVGPQLERYRYLHALHSAKNYLAARACKRNTSY